MSSLQRVDNFFMNKQLRDNINIMRADLTDIQRQISTGKKFDTFKELSAQGIIESTLGFKVSIERTQKFIESNNIITTRLNSYELIIEQLIDIADDAKQLIMNEMNPVIGQNVPLQQIMEAKLEDIANNLNIQIESRYLFSGSKTNVAPITLPLQSQQANIDYDTLEVDDRYYNGDNVTLTSQVNDSTYVDYNIKANAPGFQNLIASMFLAIRGETTQDSEILKEAFTLVSSSIEELNTLRSNVQVNKFSIEDINFQHEEVKLFLNGTISNLTETDIAEASIMFAGKETSLQASFVIFSRMSSLRLSDYL